MSGHRRRRGPGRWDQTGDAFDEGALRKALDDMEADMEADDELEGLRQLMGVAADGLRNACQMAGVDVTRLLIVMQVDDETGPVNLAGSWPLGEQLEAALLAAEGAIILRGTAEQ